MKLHAETKAFLAALHRLSLVVPKGAAAKVGVLGCVKLEATSHVFDELQLAGTDGHAVGQVTLEVDIEDGDTILPDFARLLALVESCPSDTVELSTNKAGKLEVRSGAFRASIGLQEPDLYPTLPEAPSTASVYAPALFPALARGALVFNEKESDHGSILWRVQDGAGTIVSTARTAGSLEDFPAAGPESPVGDVQPERLLPRDWTILRSWAGVGALNGAHVVEHAADERWTFWAGPDWRLWFGKPEGSVAMTSYARAFGSSTVGSEISPEALAAIKQGCEAVSGAVTNGRDAVVILTGGPEGFSAKVRADDAVAWEDETAVPEINWQAGSAENLLKALSVIGEKEGQIMLSMSPKGDGLRLERGGLVCLVAGFK